ncbi:hypothetical protein QUF72_05980 [Desulfobacterales bacterium HSG2]|nr:hypothetical protein [Desulfobacterales bacterium HSG2]
MTNDEKNMNRSWVVTQLIYGVALLLAGLGIFYMMPQKMSQMEAMEVTSFYMNFTRFCFYLIGVLLIGGGLKKIYDNYQKLENKDQG